MTDKSFHKEKKEPLSFSEKVWKYCFIGLLLILFGWSQSEIFADGSTLSDNSSFEDSFSDLSRDHYNKPDNPFSLPFNSSLPSDEPERVTEKEFKDLTEDDPEFVHSQITAINYTFYCTLKSQSLQLANSLQNRPSVPLFILYSSWKSFLI